MMEVCDVCDVLPNSSFSAGTQDLLLSFSQHFGGQLLRKALLHLLYPGFSETPGVFGTNGNSTSQNKDLTSAGYGYGSIWFCDTQ